jgi:hypothetical protein
MGETLFPAGTSDGASVPPPVPDEFPDTSSAALEAAFDQAPQQQLRFDDMRLRIGDRIQLQVPISASLERHVVKLIGYVENVTLMVTAPMMNGLRVNLVENDPVVARVFSAQRAFGFSSTVERVCRIPYEYLHLSFPTQIQGAMIRKAPRVRTRIVASIAGPDGGEERAAGVIANLSADGALVKTRRGSFAKDEVIQLAFRINVHNLDAYLSLAAIVRSVNDEQGDDGTPMTSYGTQFTAMGANDSMILQSMIYQQMVEQPHSLV